MAHIDKAVAQMKVLAADDNDINREFLLGVLGPNVANLTVVADGTQAVAAACADHHDVLLLDQHMPGHDGLQVLQIVRQHYREQWPGLLQPLCIAFTADARKTEQDRLLAAGFDGFLTKPIAAAQLLSNIELINEHPGHPLINARSQRHISEQLNDKQALKRLDNNRELLRSMRQQLLQELPESINRINHSSHVGDWNQAAKLAHKIAGGAAYTGAEMLAEACLQLEASVSATAAKKQLAHLQFREQALQTLALMHQSLQLAAATEQTSGTDSPA
ncbi:MAG: response regulator [Gammaproteobacteria bacterium]|nr:response regulator [Gammaproteobacteria bacterium]